MIATIFIDEAGRLRSGWRFLLGAITVVFSFWISEYAMRAVTSNIVIQNVFNRVISTLIMVVVFLWLSRVADQAPEPADYIGLGPKRPWAMDLVRGYCCGALLVSACVGVLAIVGRYSITPTGALQVSRPVAVIVVAWILIFGAITEELGFRSYAFLRLIESFENLLKVPQLPSLQRHARTISVWLAILPLSVFFGLGHLHNPNVSKWGVANIILVGVFFGLLMVRTGSLWLLWGLHFGWNFTLGTLYGLPVSGIDQFAVLWKGRAEGPLWATGGAFGIEASASAPVVILIGILVLLIAKKPLSRAAASGI